MINVNQIDNNRCIGCGGCSLICPVEAINIKRDEKGFFRPEINEKCISCGQCIKVCYKNIIIEKEDDIWKIEKSNALLAYNKDKVARYRASSGGIGESIYNYALKEGYKIVGVIYDYDENIAKHIIADNKEDVEKIIGSKYIPSYTEEAFKNLNKNEKYIIIGTPCQIYSIRKYMIEKSIENWILVDFFCHGAPSLNLWDRYLEEQNNIYKLGKIKKINFRDKEVGWHKFSMTITGETGSYSKTLLEDKFLQCFLKNVDLQDACYSCELRFNKLYSDIRIGDFWGAKCEADEEGSSIVLVNTELGKLVFKSLENIYSESIKFNELKESQYVPEIGIPKEKIPFQKSLIEDEFDVTYKKIINPMLYKQKFKATIRKKLNCLKKIMGR